jgi:hypothetical protein
MMAMATIAPGLSMGIDPAEAASGHNQRYIELVKAITETAKLKEGLAQAREHPGTPIAFKIDTTRQGAGARSDGSEICSLDIMMRRDPRAEITHMTVTFYGFDGKAVGKPRACEITGNGGPRTLGSTTVDTNPHK